MYVSWPATRLWLLPAAAAVGCEEEALGVAAAMAAVEGGGSSRGSPGLSRARKGKADESTMHLSPGRPQCLFCVFE